MDILKKIGNFFTTAEPIDLVILAVLIIIPILALIILIVSMVKGARRRRAEKESAELEEPLVFSQENPSTATLSKDTDRVFVYVPQSQPQPKVQQKTKISIKNMDKADKSLLAATAIFCIGLGVMIQRAFLKNK